MRFIVRHITGKVRWIILMCFLCHELYLQNFGKDKAYISNMQEMIEMEVKV